MCQEEIFSIFCKLCPRAYPVYNCTVLLYFVSHVSLIWPIDSYSVDAHHWGCTEDAASATALLLFSPSQSFSSFKLFFFICSSWSSAMLFHRQLLTHSASSSVRPRRTQDTWRHSGHLMLSMPPRCVAMVFRQGLQNVWLQKRTRGTCLLRQ